MNFPIPTTPCLRTLSKMVFLNCSDENLVKLVAFAGSAQMCLLTLKFSPPGIL